MCANSKNNYLTVHINQKALKNLQYAKEAKIYKTSNFIILKRHWKVQGKKLSIIPIYKSVIRLRNKFRKIKDKNLDSINSFKASIKGYLNNFSNSHTLSQKIFNLGLEF